MTRLALVALLAVSALPTIAGLAAALVVGLDASAMGRVLSTPGIGLSMASSIWSGVLSLLLSLCLAHLAVALAVSGGWRRRLNSMALPLLAMPHLAVGIGLALVLAPSGLLLRLLSPWATGFELPPDWLIVRDPAGLSLVAGLVLKETCFLIMALMAALAQVPAARLQQQAASLGYGSLKAWLVGVAPLLQRQIRLPLAAVLVFGITNVELAIPLGPGLPPTYAVVLWRWFTDPDPMIQSQAYAGSVLLLLIVVLCMGLVTGLGRFGRGIFQRIATDGARWRAEQSWRRAFGGLLIVPWLLGVLGLVAIVLRSTAGPWRFPALLPARDTVSVWRDVPALVGDVSATTLSLAVATALIGTALVLPAAERGAASSSLRRAVGVALFVPLLVPQMTFLFGVQVLLARLHVDGTFVAVVWSHLIFALPYLWGVLAPARAALDPRYAQVALTLGRTPWQTWLTVTAPLLARATLLALALAFSVSVALYLPTLFAGAGRVTTAATEAAAAAASGSLRLAAVHAILLAFAPLTAFFLAYAVSGFLFRHRQGVPR